MKHESIIVERTYHASPEKVWKAITDKDEMKHWYFPLAEFKAEVGFTFEFTGGPDEEHQYLHRCIVTEVEPGKKLVYSWEYPGYEGISYVSWELFPEGKHTRLVLTHEGVDRFDPNVSDFARRNFEAGWTEIIGTLLRDYLEGSR